MYKIKTFFYVSKFWLTKLFWHKSDFDSKILCLKIGTTNLQSSKKEKGSTFTEYYSNKIYVGVIFAVNWHFYWLRYYLCSIKVSDILENGMILQMIKVKSILISVFSSDRSSGSSSVRDICEFWFWFRTLISLESVFKLSLSCL